MQTVLKDLQDNCTQSRKVKFHNFNITNISSPSFISHLKYLISATITLVLRRIKSNVKEYYDSSKGSFASNKIMKIFSINCVFIYKCNFSFF